MKTLKIENILLAAALCALAGVMTGCLSVTYKQSSDRLNQTEETKVTARGLFKDTSLAGVIGSTTVNTKGTNGTTYASIRNVGATNLVTVVSTNAAGIIEGAGSAAGNVIGEAVGAAVTP